MIPDLFSHDCLPHALSCSLAEATTTGILLDLKMSDQTVLPMRVDLLTDQMIRLRVQPSGDFQPSLPEQDGFLKTNWPAAAVDVHEQENRLLVQGRELTLELTKDDFSFALRDDAQALTRSAASTGLRLGQGLCALTMQSPTDEAFLGLGYQGARYIYPFSPDWAPLNHRGKALHMTGLTSHRSYYIPFFLSSRGYGLFVNTLTRSHWDLAKTHQDRYAIAMAQEALDVYLIRGPSFRDILTRYTELVGRPSMPPRETGTTVMARLITTGVPQPPPTKPEAGPSPDSEIEAIEKKARAQAAVDPYVGMNVRWFDQREIEAKARHLREQHICCDRFAIDSAWQTIRGSLEWVSQIPNPADMLALLNRLDFIPELWQRATIEYGDYPLFREAKAKGYLVTGPDGEPFRGAMNDERKVLVDFTNPDAVRWWNAKTAELVRMGARAFKLDSESGGYSEALPEAGTIRFANGHSGDELENYHGMLYVKAVYDGMKEALNGERPNLRVYYPAYFASGRFPYSSIGDRRHRCPQEVRVRIAINMGLAGVPFWLGIDYTPFGLPHADTAYNTRLIPYTYSHWRQACDTGLPILRAMVLDYQDDPQSFLADTQFMYGDAFLVAPEIPGSPDARQVLPPKTEICGMEEAWEKGRHWRRIYFPAGEWTNHWSKEKYRGPEWRSVQVLPDRQPTFVRGGAIIPFGPEQEYANQHPLDPLTLEIYPHGTSSFTLYEDDGRTLACDTGQRAETHIHCREQAEGVNIEIEAATGSYPDLPKSRTVILKIVGTQCPDTVTVNGTTIASHQPSADRPAGATWSYRKNGDYDRLLEVTLPQQPTDKATIIHLSGAHPVRYYV